MFTWCSGPLQAEPLLSHEEAISVQGPAALQVPQLASGRRIPQLACLEAPGDSVGRVLTLGIKGMLSRLCIMVNEFGAFWTSVFRLALHDCSKHKACVSTVEFLASFLQLSACLLCSQVLEDHVQRTRTVSLRTPTKAPEQANSSTAETKRNQSLRPPSANCSSQIQLHTTSRSAGTVKSPPAMLLLCQSDWNMNSAWPRGFWFVSCRWLS